MQQSERLFFEKLCTEMAQTKKSRFAFLQISSFRLLCYSSVSKMINIRFESVILLLTEILDAHHCYIVELFCFADKVADIGVDSFQ